MAPFKIAAFRGN